MRLLILSIFTFILASCNNNVFYETSGPTDRPHFLIVKSLDGTFKSHTNRAHVWEEHEFIFGARELYVEEKQTFLNHRLDIEFISPSGKLIKVPGYFRGNNLVHLSSDEFGDSNEGDHWKAHFIPDEAGLWSFEVSFVKGNRAAIDLSVASERVKGIDRKKGKFRVLEPELNSTSTGFRKRGTLQDVKERYLYFSSTGEPWLKTGAGSPENILAYSDFDGTYDTGGNNFPALGENQLHEFEPHLKDWREGDPTWGPRWSRVKGKAIIGLMNYYADVGVNNQYMVTMNYEGDGWDVFPYVDPKDPYVFDVSKLAQWQILFDYMDAKGIAKNILLTETENESYFEVMDGVEIGKDFADSRMLYYREMVARFGHNLGLVWNLGEENGIEGVGGNDPYRQPTSLEQRRQFAQYIRNLDPYGHAVVSHNWPDNEEPTFGDLLGDPDFSGISLQAHHNYFDKAKEWTDRSAAAGRPWVMMVDEPLGWEYGAQPDAEVTDHKRAIEGVLWPSLMGGASGVDWYFGWQNNAATSDLSNEDQRSRHELWVASAKVRKFWEENFDLLTLEARREGDDIIMTGKDKQGGDIMLTAKRKMPVLTEVEGHNPWEYELLSLILEQGGETRIIDPMDPQ